MPGERRLQPLLAERRLAVLDREGGEADDRDGGRDHDHEPDRGEEAPRQRPARLARLLGEVGDGLEAGVGEHRQRQREREVVPGRRDAEVGPLRERVRREEQRETEDHEQELRREVEPGDDEARRVELGTAHEPHGGDREDDADGDDDVPRRLAKAVDPERRPEVVRQEQRRERDHDQVVEEERPAGEEAEDVVVRAADEGRRAAGLGQRRRALGVGERDDQEEDPRAEEHDRREAERVRGDDPEREVDRRCDLAVGDREERGGVEDALEAAELAGH